MRDEDLPMGLGLSEMIQRPAFRPEDIASEANVVLEEINMNEDDPADVAHDEFAHALWDGHVLARPVLGTRESITGMSRDVIKGYWARRYHPASVLVAAAGYLGHDDLVELVADRFGGWVGSAGDHAFRAPQITSAVRVVNRDTEQAHLVIGGEAITRGDDRRFSFGILNHVVGGGMSSRLFREVREERGLAYAVYSFACRMPTRAPMASTSARRRSRPVRCSSCAPELREVVEWGSR
jgi:predicted Zn-dependent peptidase